MGFSATALRGATRFEDRLHSTFVRRLDAKGWVPTVHGYTGYGGPGWVRVMSRVLVNRPEDQRRPMGDMVRGWRHFVTASISDTEVLVQAGTQDHVLITDRGGYIDEVVPSDLQPGWRQVTVCLPGYGTCQVPVLIVGDDVEFGVVSDVDDTVLVTSLPRPMLAAWNTFVLNEHARRPVPGMAVLYDRLIREHPGSPVMYLSTGAWNVAPTLTRFLGRNLYPPGPLLLTDWGPTTDRWFRSGQEHKRVTLRRLAREFPKIKWLLIGDDGQHDPDLYTEFATTHPINTAGVAIRHLSPTEQVLASGLLMEKDAPQAPNVPWISAPNGAGLADRLRHVGLLS